MTSRMTPHRAPGPAGMNRVGEALIAEYAVVTGKVRLGENTNVWYAVVIRGDDAHIRIGARTNVQDGTVIHCDPAADNIIGDDVTIGHGAIVHGVRIHDRALIGMGSMLLGGCVIGEGAVVGAGAVVSEDMEVPPHSLAVGVPARIVKTFDPAERDRHALETASHYVERAEEHSRGEYDGRLEA